MSDDRLALIKEQYRHARIFGPLDVSWLIAEIEALRSRCEAAEAQNELLEEDALRFLRQRNAALERAAADIHPGPDGADDIIRREMVREWVDEGHDRVDEEDRQRLTAIQRMIAAEARCGAAEAALTDLLRATDVLDGWEGCVDIDYAEASWEPCYECWGCAITTAVEGRNKASDVLAAATGTSEQ